MKRNQDHLKDLPILTSNQLDIVKTGDGSCTLLNTALNETYHSVNGALTESLHVFITNGLLRYETEAEEIHILEVGLGTGLNALLTLENIPKGKIVYYTALEPFPVSTELALEYYRQFEIKPTRLDLLDKITNVNTKTFSRLTDNFYFRSLTRTLQSFQVEDMATAHDGSNKVFKGFDIVYYDAFAPQKQPDMWETNTIKVAVDLLKENGLLTSYCAQGQFKRTLKTLNLLVERLPGPPEKREMTVAIKPKVNFFN